MDFCSELESKGFSIAPDVVAPTELSHYQESVEAALKNNVSRDRAPGLRNVFESVDAAREFAASTQLRHIVEPILGANYFAVRALIFDKTSDGATGANWKVPFHQDLTIAVKKKSKWKIFLRGRSSWEYSTSSRRSRFWKECLRFACILMIAMLKTARCAFCPARIKREG